MSLHKEINFENEICEHLAANGWLYAEGDAAKYDRARWLFPDDVLAWVQTTQAQAWEAIVKNHGAQAADTLLTRFSQSLDRRGTLDVLRHAHRDARPARKDLPCAIQTGSGHERRHSGSVWREPAARRVAVRGESCVFPDHLYGTEQPWCSGPEP